MWLRSSSLRREAPKTLGLCSSVEAGRSDAPTDVALRRTPWSRQHVTRSAPAWRRAELRRKEVVQH